MKLNTNNSGVSILRVFVNSRTVNSKDNSFGYAIDIQYNDVFMNEDIKTEAEKISAWSLNYAPELLAYKFIKEREPIIEFSASQFIAGNYKVKITNVFHQYLPYTDEYESSINRISKDIIGRVTYLFRAYSLESY